VNPELAWLKSAVAQPRAAAEAEVVREDAPEAGVPGWFTCALCGERVAHETWRLELHLGRSLVFSNPHGLVFHLALWAKAIGLTFRGHPSEEHTWFEGYAWRTAFCVRCGSHVGWVFEATSAAEPRTFVGLSLAALKFITGS